MAVNHKKVEEIFELMSRQLSLEERHLLSLKLMAIPADFFEPLMDLPPGTERLTLPICITGEPLSETIIQDRI